MTRPTADQLKSAAEWLREYKGDHADDAEGIAVFEAVADWLDRQADQSAGAAKAAAMYARIRDQRAQQ